MTQGSTVRAFSALSSVYAFNGSAVGTITHLAGLRICFPDNVGSAVNITNNYALLINDQTTGTGTVTYTNRWGIYQEGASDLNYMAANLLLGSTTNNGNKLQVTGNVNVTGNGAFGQSVESVVRLVASSADNTNGTIALAARNQTGTAAFFVYGDLSSYLAGPVGIGTNAPNAPLEVQADSGGTGIRIKGRAAANSGTLRFYDNASSVQIGKVESSDNSFEIGALNNTYAAFLTNGSEKMRISSAGDVGIGITAPQARLNVSLSTNTDSLQTITRLGANNLAGELKVLDFRYQGSTNLLFLQTQAVGTDPNFVFQVGSTEVFRTTSGNVLIGTTTNAGQKLQVNGSVSIPHSNLYRSGSNAIKSSDSITVSTSATTIFTSQQVGSVDSGNLVVVTGVKSGTGDNFCDLVLFMTNGSAVTVSSTVIGSPPARTYSVSGNNLQLTMASGTYVTGTGGFIQGYNLTF